MKIVNSTEFPQLNDILKKHGAEGEEELGQAQFAELLQQVLQDIADALAEKRIIIIQNIKIINGSKLRMVIQHLVFPVSLIILLFWYSRKSDEKS